MFKDRKLGSVCSLISVYPPARALLLADPDAIKFVTSSPTSRSSFVKPLWINRPLMLYGRNVGVLDGEQWRRHRRIVTGPAASELVIRSAWEESFRVMGACFDDWHSRDRGGGEEVRVESVVELMLKMTLFVICGTAFSLRPPWDDDVPEDLPEGHRLNLRQALHGVLTLALWKCASPPVRPHPSLPLDCLRAEDARQWLYRFPIKRLHRADLAYREFGSYLLEMIRTRREQGASEGRKDLLAALVEASGDGGSSESEGGGKGEEKLSDEEVQGNIYIFLLAGHGASPFPPSPPGKDADGGRGQRRRRTRSGSRLPFWRSTPPSNKSSSSPCPPPSPHPPSTVRHTTITQA